MRRASPSPSSTCAIAPDDLAALFVSARVHLCECLRAWARDLDDMERMGTASVDRFLALRPGSPSMSTLRGYVLLKHRRYEEALLVAEEVLRIEAEYPEALAPLAMAQLRLSRTAQAQAALPALLQSATARAWQLSNSPVPEDAAFYAALRRGGLAD